MNEAFIEGKWLIGEGWVSMYVYKEGANWKGD